MNKIIDWVKNIRLDRILTVFLVGILLFVSTACSGNVLAKTADEVREEVPGSAVTSPYKGGMNDYSDVDPRKNTSAAEAKAKGLVDNAQSNLQKRADDPEQYVENYRGGAPLGERVQKIGENIGQAAENVKQDLSKGTQENAQNVKQTSQSAAKNVKKGTQEATAKTSEAAQNAGDAVKSKVNRDISRVQRTVDKVADDIDN